ncbi:MAG: PEGA domain-containing protein [Patescibacteria group bacterium]|nr:PEGA domain-containing protein [Patescibacteria group bacterium]
MLKKLLVSLIILSLTVFLTGCTLPSRKKSALSVSTTPNATIFLDGEHLGQTPYYNEKLKPGDYVLKIVPESSGQALNPWEGRVTLSPGILTVVNRELGLTQDDSSGEILSFESNADKNATSISVVTTPDGAVVNLDGEPKGFAPISLDNTTEGDHILLISSPGYQEKTIKAKTVKGNKLIVSVQLARAAVAPPTETETQEEATPAASPKTTPTPTPTASPKTSTSSANLKNSVEALKSPGWANVREDSSAAAAILDKIYFGDQYPILDTAAEGGHTWYKIEYKTGKNGWVRDDVVEKF